MWLLFWCVIVCTDVAETDEAGGRISPIADSLQHDNVFLARKFFTQPRRSVKISLLGNGHRDFLLSSQTRTGA